VGEAASGSVNGVDNGVDASHTSAMPSTTQPRVELSRELILDAAQTIVDLDGESALTYRRLGQQLEADPTAAYRHFRNKDELLLALADRLLGQAMTDVPDDLEWRGTLREMAHALYRSLTRHPRLAVLISARTTAGEHEAIGIERTLKTLVDAGLSIEEAVTVWRSLADTILAWCGLSAAFMSLPAESQARDKDAWATTYRSLPVDRFPAIAAARPYIEDEYDAFPSALELLLDGIEVRIANTTKESQ